MCQVAGGHIFWYLCHYCASECHWVFRARPIGSSSWEMKKLAGRMRRFSLIKYYCLAISFLALDHSVSVIVLSVAKVKH
jgi:hypothetical protein